LRDIHVAGTSLIGRGTVYPIRLFMAAGQPIGRCAWLPNRGTGDDQSFPGGVGMREAPSLDGLAHLRPELLQTFSIRHRLRPDGMSNQRQAGFPLRADQAARSSGLNLMAG